LKLFRPLEAFPPCGHNEKSPKFALFADFRLRRAERLAYIRTMFLNLRSLSHPGRAAAALALVAFAFGATAATMLRSTGHSQAAAAPRPVASLPSAGAIGYPAEVIRVFDGDTFEARVQVWPGLEITTKVRLRGIDAPELRARCAEERALAESARGALSALLARGRVGIRQVKLDKYGGRVVAEASAGNTQDIAATLIAGGHARRYHGGRREGWCEARPS
jgi:endonuclease YncB( thermonuclease family)